MVFEQEAAFETALINLLTEKYGWEPEILRYKTEEDLIQNWKQILFENNRDVDRLNDVRKRQIMGRIEMTCEVCQNIHETHRDSPGVSVSFRYRGQQSPTLTGSAGECR